MSDPITIICAVGPSQPPAPSTAVSVNNVVISWSAPVTNNGSPITSYKVYIEESDGLSYSVETEYCDGSNAEIFA